MTEDQRVYIQVPLEDMQKLVDLAQEAAEDLERLVHHEHQGDHPSTVRRRQRDLELSGNLAEAAQTLRAYW